MEKDLFIASCQTHIDLIVGAQVKIVAMDNEFDVDCLTICIKQPKDKLNQEVWDHTCFVSNSLDTRPKGAHGAGYLKALMDVAGANVVYGTVAFQCKNSSIIKVDMDLVKGVVCNKEVAVECVE